MIHAIIVTYNVRCSDSKTCQSLLKQNTHGFDVIVFDNSVRDYGNRDFCVEHGWKFLGGNGNRGLSVAYNAAIDFLKGAGETGWICLLDDDTTLPEDFIHKVTEYVGTRQAIDIWLPILRQNEKIISPCRIQRRNRYFTTVNECLDAPPNDLQAFNSCMTINLSVFSDYRYDERIFLDGVDHAFLRDMKCKEKKIGVIPIVCEQRFSGGEKVPQSSAITRFRIYRKDSRILYEATPIRYWLIVGKRALHLTLMYRSIDFIKILLSKQNENN